MMINLIISFTDKKQMHFSTSYVIKCFKISLKIHMHLSKSLLTLGSPWEAKIVRRRSNGYDPTVAAHPAKAPLK